MKFKSQTKRILSRMLQMILLLAVLVGGGFLLPMYTAPAIFSAFSVTPLSSHDGGQVSVRIDNRNAENGEQVQFTASSPGKTTQITALKYSCEISDVSLLFSVNTGADKKLPCGTYVYVPAESRQSLVVRTDRSDVGYVPMTIRIDSGDRSGEISTVIAVSRVRTDQSSTLSDTAQVTVREFGAVR